MDNGEIILQEWPSIADERGKEAWSVSGGFPHLDGVPCWRDLKDEKRRQSAVILGCTKIEGRLSVLCVKRSTCMRRHAGQLAFPGGAREPGDETPLETALRECHEELGIPPGKFSMEVMLPKEYAYSSDFVIYPFVAQVDFDEIRRYIRPDPVELESAFLVCVDRLRLPPELFWGRSEDRTFMYPVFRTDGKRVIWGATARILWRFLRSLKKQNGAVPCL